MIATRASHSTSPERGLSSPQQRSTEDGAAKTSESSLHSQPPADSKVRAPRDGSSNGQGAPERFTLDGGAELEEHLAHTCESVLAGVRGIIPARKLEALLLGGGYGRGEGGVLRTETG